MTQNEVYDIMKIKFHKQMRPDYVQPIVRDTVIGKDSTYLMLVLFHMQTSGFGVINYYNNDNYIPLLFKSNSLIGKDWDDFNNLVKDSLIVDEKGKSQKVDTRKNRDRKIEPYSAGTGFIIHSKGYIVTNFHVIDGHNKISVYLPSAEKNFEAKIKLFDEYNDIAIIQVIDSSFNKYLSRLIPYSFGSDVKIGQEVFTIGFPLSNFLGQSSPKLSVGIINSNTGLDEDPRVYQISNPIQPGNSGGALFNANGEVIGIVFSTLNSKFFLDYNNTVPQNVNFAIKVNLLLNLVEMLPERDEILERKTILNDLELEELFLVIQPFIVGIKTYK